VAVSRVHGKEVPGSSKCGEFLDELRTTALCSEGLSLLGVRLSVGRYP
jgi:hypothetical protein